MSYEIIILAAGKGSRMFSRIPKVLHTLGGTTMLDHQLNTIETIDDIQAVHIVVGQDHQQLQDAISSRRTSNIRIAHQEQQIGTANAAHQALVNCSPDSTVVIIAGDIPLISATTIKSLIAQSEKNTLAILQANLENPFGYGRIVRNKAGKIVHIVEEKDATPEQKKIQQVYCGIIAGKADRINTWLQQIQCNNAQSEYYLTDLIAISISDGVQPTTVNAIDIFDYSGINSQSQLVQLERLWQSKQAEEYMAAGLRLYDPNRFDIRGNLVHGQDVNIDINVIIIGNVSLGDGVNIGSHCVLNNCSIGANTQVEPFCHVNNAQIGKHCAIGPYARIRPGSIIGENVTVGNFVETKNSTFADNTKANHLSYIGDAIIGKNTNIGAGTITCNYDSVKKHQTIIGDRVFIGSNSSLIAPVTIGSDATIAAGSVITEDVTKNSLAIARSRQTVKNNWKKEKK